MIPTGESFHHVMLSSTLIFCLKLENQQKVGMMQQLYTSFSKLNTNTKQVSDCGLLVDFNFSSCVYLSSAVDFGLASFHEAGTSIQLLQKLLS